MLQKRSALVAVSCKLQLQTSKPCQAGKFFQRERSRARHIVTDGKLLQHSAAAKSIYVRSVHLQWRTVCRGCMPPHTLKGKDLLWIPLSENRQACSDHE